jgi:hypothetical protein
MKLGYFTSEDEYYLVEKRISYFDNAEAYINYLIDAMNELSHLKVIDSEIQFYEEEIGVSLVLMNPKETTLHPYDNKI